MGMRINTNIEAFNAQRNLANTATQYAKSVEKLSSGLRINRAGDDAAGSVGASAAAADCKRTITNGGSESSEAGAVMSVATQNATLTGTTGAAAAANGTITVNGTGFTITSGDTLASVATQITGGG